MAVWRWGGGKGAWNEVVDAYEHIRHFAFGDNPDFTIRFDHTTGYHEFGYAKYSQIFIDGVFAFLVYYKREHVMTIGFSIVEKKGVLLQQVQSAKQNGNRYLYKLPNNRMEFVLELFRANFPGYALYVIDGKCLAKKTLADYRNSLERVHDPLQKSWCENQIAHLEADSERLTSFYRNTGKFTLDNARKINGLTHYSVG